MGCPLLCERSWQGIDTVESSTLGNTLNVARASRLMGVSAIQDKTRSTTVPAIFRPLGYPKAGGTEDQLNQRQQGLHCKSRHSILPPSRKAVDGTDM